MYYVEYSVGQSGFECEFGEAVCSQWGLGCRFEDCGVTERQGGRDLPGGQHQGCVPGADRRDHAGRRVEHVGQQIPVGVGLVGGHRRVVGEEPQVVRHARDFGVQGLVDALTAVAGFELGEFFAVLVDLVGDRVQDLCAFLRRHLWPGPAVEGVAGGGDRSLSVFGGALGYDTE